MAGMESAAEAGDLVARTVVVAEAAPECKRARLVGCGSEDTAAASTTVRDCPPSTKIEKLDSVSPVIASCSVDRTSDLHPCQILQSEQPHQLSDLNFGGVAEHRNIDHVTGDDRDNVDDGDIVNDGDDSNSSSCDGSLLASTASSPVMESDEDANESKWAPTAGAMEWLQQQMQSGADPRDVLKELLPSQADSIPPSIPNLALWKFIASILCEGPRRSKLTEFNTLDDVINLLRKCNKIIILTGAGVSVSCGIPDFRSRNGLYARIATDFPDLPDPQALFDISYFRRNPLPFFKFAKEIYPGKFAPSPSHRFIKLLEDHGKLLCNYTQNIDTLERAAGIKSVIECHGSFATASCMTCRHKINCDDIKNDIENQVVPHCKVCPTDPGVVKPDIVFFGENLPEHFHERMAEDKEKCDLLIVMGSSLKVRPVSLIPSALPATVPQILINKEPLPHQRFDVELMGDCDTIVSELCCRLGYDSWQLFEESAEQQKCRSPMQQILFDELSETCVSRRESLATVVSLCSGVNSCQESCGAAADCVSRQKCAVAEASENPVALSPDPAVLLTQPLVDTCHAIASSVAPPNSLLVSCGGGISDAHLGNGDIGDEKAATACHDCADSAKTGTRDFGAAACDAATSHAAANAAKEQQHQRPLAERLPGNTFLFIPPSKHIFPGAEFYIDDIGESSSSDADDTDEWSSSVHNEEEGPVHSDDEPDARETRSDPPPPDAHSTTTASGRDG